MEVEKMSYYFAGGMYKENDRLVFGAVHPTKGLPYVTKSPRGIPVTSHHSSVYLISEDFTKALLIKNNGTVPSPREVELSLSLKERLRRAVKVLETGGEDYGAQL